MQKAWLRLRQKLQLLLGFQRLKVETQIAAAFARAAVTASTRNLDPAVPCTWEFCGFSQHGEDGIVDYLCSKLLARNRYFFEIGSADGLENCTAWLALGRGYGGVMVEGDSKLSRLASYAFHTHLRNVLMIDLMVNAENIVSLLKTCPYPDPDVFVIDIDGIDLHVLKRVLELNYRPKLIVVEYNSAFGPEQAVTIPYQAQFARWQAHSSGLYYGASIAAWSKLMSPYGYQFVTVESSGCNAFFIDPKAFPEGFASSIRGTAFLENNGDLNGATSPFRDSQGDLVVPKRLWVNQFKMIADLPLVKI